MLYRNSKMTYYLTHGLNNGGCFCRKPLREKTEGDLLLNILNAGIDGSSSSLCMAALNRYFYPIIYIIYYVISLFRVVIPMGYGKFTFHLLLCNKSGGLWGENPLAFLCFTLHNGD